VVVHAGVGAARRRGHGSAGPDVDGVKEFRRAYCNLWPDEPDTGWQVLPRELWQELQI
jgi:hypothetical protein